MKVRIKKLPRTYKLQGRQLVKKSHGGRSGDQFDYGLVTMPQYATGGDFYMGSNSSTNNTLRPIPRDEANLEAEKGETALTDLNNDGTFELYNVGGNRHGSGGTPLNLPEQSFIYSDTRAMKLNRNELAELGVDSKKKMTPADVSKKFPLNKYYETLDNADASDMIGTDTAEYMLEKNKKKLSHLAFLQEAKKSFSDGVPTAAFPYLKEKGINPIEFTAKVEGISKQEAEMKQLMSMPIDVREKVMQLKQMISMADQQQGPPQGMPPQGPPQGMPPQGMMPPPQMMARYGGYVPQYYAYGGDLPQAQFGWISDAASWVGDTASSAASWAGDKVSQGADYLQNQYQDSALYNVGQKVLDYGQDALSVAGTFPILGAIPDAINTGISTARVAGSAALGDDEAVKKNTEDLAWNAAAIIPGAGQAATAAKFAKRGVQAYKTAQPIVKNIAKAHNIVEGVTNTTENILDESTVAKGSIADTLSTPTTPGVEQTVEGPSEALAVAAQSEAPEATTVTPTTPTMEAETIAQEPDAEDIVEDVVTDSSDTQEESEDDMWARKEAKRAAMFAMYGGDPFKTNALHEFIYGGSLPMYQNAGEVPMHESGLSQKQADDWLSQGYKWEDTDGDGVGDTWTHSIYSETEIAEQERRAKENLITGTQDIGEEGIVDMQIPIDGIYHDPDSPGDVYSQDDFDARHGELISTIDADGDGVPDFQDTDFDMANPEHTGKFQKAYNAKLCETWEASDALKAQYATCEDYLVAAGGFHDKGDKVMRQDDMFGEYTYTRPSTSVIEEEDPCPEDVKVAKMAECEEKGLPFDAATCDCGAKVDDCEDEETKRAACEEEGNIWDSANCKCQAGPEDVEEVDEVDPEFWLQDRLGVMNAIDNKFRIKKRYPWTPIEETQTIDPVFQDPTRAYAAIGEQANAAAHTASAFSGPQRAAAVQARAQGAAAEQIANVSAQVQGANVGIANEAQKTNALFAADTERINKANLKKLYDDTMLVEQNYDNAISKANTELTKQIQNAFTNRADTYNLNTLYPQFNIDPRTGGLIDVTNARDNVPTKRTDADLDTEYNRLISQCANNNKDGICPEDMQKIIWKQVYQSNTNTTSTDDSWKDVALDQGTDPVQQRFGGERKARILKKGRELRKWFSPLQGKNAY